MREVQGGIITSAFFIMFFSMSGLLRAVLHYISPLTVAVNIGIVGLSLYSSGMRWGSTQQEHRSAEAWTGLLDPQVPSLLTGFGLLTLSCGVVSLRSVSHAVVLPTVRSWALS